MEEEIGDITFPEVKGNNVDEGLISAVQHIDQWVRKQRPQ